MRRADRRDSSDDNTLHNPRSQQSEPISYHELKSSLMTVRAQKTELQQRVQEVEEQAGQNHQLYLEAQQKHQSAIALFQGEQQKYVNADTISGKAIQVPNITDSLSRSTDAGTVLSHALHSRTSP